MPRVAIFGAAGAVGHAVGAELARRGIGFRVVGRSAARLAEAFRGTPGAEPLAADLTTPESAEAAARGIDTVVYAVGVPYDRFTLHPALMAATLDGAARAGVARLVVVSSVYSYGPPRTPRVAETHPREPEARKGEMRRRQEDLVIKASARGRVKAIVLHLPDFYGPHAEHSLANPIVRAALAGKGATWLGPVDLPHEFVFVPDVGPVVADLATRDDVWGHRWNLAGAGTITPRDFMTAAYRAAGHEPRWRSVGKLALRLAGLTNPLLRELVEMHYLQTTPVVLDDAKLQAKLGPIRKTPYSEGIARTLDWMRPRA
jgi:nucleoside-diphosphate-sugar epimerase